MRVTRSSRLREGQSLTFHSFFGVVPTAGQLEEERARIAVLGRRLRTELGLRTDAVAVVDTPVGAELATVGIAGTLTIGNRTLDIRPKHVSDPAEDWHSPLLAMLERAERRRSHFSRLRMLRHHRLTFVDQVAMSLAYELEAATRHAEVRSYRSHREELPQVRGRILVTQQLRSALLKPHRVVCEVDTLTADNPVNKLLRWAARDLGVLTRDPQVRRELSVQAERLPDVVPFAAPPAQLSFVLPRQYHHYRGAVDIALSFARGRGVERGLTSLSGAGFVVGTERLFESFIEGSIAAALADKPGWRSEAQVRSVFATPLGSERTFYSKPDNLVVRDGTPVLVVDAKYKRFEDDITDGGTFGSKPSHSDLYQMAAACVAHHVPRALLVYPRLSGIDKDWVPKWWSIAMTGHEILVGAVTVPLFSLGNPDGQLRFDDELRALLVTAATEDPSQGDRRNS